MPQVTKMAYGARSLACKDPYGWDPTRWYSDLPAWKIQGKHREIVQDDAV